MGDRVALAQMIAADVDRRLLSGGDDRRRTERRGTRGRRTRGDGAGGCGEGGGEQRGGDGGAAERAMWGGGWHVHTIAPTWPNVRPPQGASLRTRSNLTQTVRGMSQGAVGREQNGRLLATTALGGHQWGPGTARPSSRSAGVGSRPRALPSARDGATRLRPRRRPPLSRASVLSRAGLRRSADGARTVSAEDGWTPEEVCLRCRPRSSHRTR
jgi:hypothetical protein